jgi:hypothetical protein
MDIDETDFSSPWLLHQWTIAGIVSAAARFIPVPFLDEIVRGRCHRFVVSQTLAAHQTDLTIDDFDHFFSRDRGCVAGCLGIVLLAPLKLLLFPIRKMVAIFTSVRGVPLEITRTVLLGRTLDRYLRHSLLPACQSKSEVAAQTARMRKAFEEAFTGMDWRSVRAAMKDALATVEGWKSAAAFNARRTAERSSLDNKEIETSPKIEASAARVEQVLDSPETLELFAEFDRRFDDAMARIDA